MDIKACNKCGGDIIWVEAYNGKYIPCEPNTIEVTELDEDDAPFLTLNGVWIGLKRAQDEEVEVYVPHFKYCG